MRFCSFRMSIIFLLVMHAGCANRMITSEPANVSTFEVHLVALNATVFKDSTDQSSQLPQSRKCNIDAGERLTLRDDPKITRSENGDHYKITLVPEQNLRAACPLESGYVFSSHFRQELIQAKPKLDGSATPIASQPPMLTPQDDKPTTDFFNWPVSGGVLTSGFGLRYGALHEGIDIALMTGTSVVAAADGQIAFAGWNNARYGGLVRISHANNFETRYAHNSDLLDMAVGKVVLKGDEIAKSGNTGQSTGPHLHFEIRIKGDAIDPMRLLPRRSN